MIKYIDEEYTELINCYNIDPQLSFIPDQLINTFIRPFAYRIMSDIKKTVENNTQQVNSVVKQNKRAAESATKARYS